jgi:hypothetical protein
MNRILGLIKKIGPTEYCLILFAVVAIGAAIDLRIAPGYFTGAQNSASKAAMFAIKLPATTPLR